MREALEKQIMYAAFYFVDFFKFFAKDEIVSLSTLFSTEGVEGVVNILSKIFVN